MNPGRAFAFSLSIVHVFLGGWALVGFAEWYIASTPWPTVSNPLFPRSILFMQWTLILASAVVFVTGYTMRWRRTPEAMAIVYTAMATLCAVETFVYMVGDWRFEAMALEYLAYMGDPRLSLPIGCLSIEVVVWTREHSLDIPGPEAANVACGELLAERLDLGRSLPSCRGLS
jgi:hypothetical protein